MKFMSNFRMLLTTVGSCCWHQYFKAVKTTYGAYRSVTKKGAQQVSGSIKLRSLHQLHSVKPPSNEVLAIHSSLHIVCKRNWHIDVAAQSLSSVLQRFSASRRIQGMLESGSAPDDQEQEAKLSLGQPTVLPHSRLHRVRKKTAPLNMSK